MANPTNPNRVVRVKDLNRFKGNTDGLYATKTANSGKADKVGTGHGDEIALYNNNGNLKTSDKKLSDFAAAEHTHTKSEITDFSHTHDDRYYQKSQVYQKSETYTKKETEGYVQSKFGLKYDAANRAVIVPVASVATYQKSKRMIDFTGIAY